MNIMYCNDLKKFQVIGKLICITPRLKILIFENVDNTFGLEFGHEKMKNVVKKFIANYYEKSLIAIPTDIKFFHSTIEKIVAIYDPNIYSLAELSYTLDQEIIGDND